MYYVALIHEENGAFGVSFPDAPGCVAVETTLDDALRSAGEALAFHLEDDAEAPAPRSADEIARDADWAEALSGARIAYVPLIRMTGRKAPFTLSIDKGLMAAADAAAKRRGVTRSALVADALQKSVLED